MENIEKVVGDFKPFTEMNDYEEEEQVWQRSHDYTGLSIRKRIPLTGDGIPRKCTLDLRKTCYYSRSAQNIGCYCDYMGITGISKNSLGVKSDACTLYVPVKDKKASWHFNKCLDDNERCGRKCGN